MEENEQQGIKIKSEAFLARNLDKRREVILEEAERSAKSRKNFFTIALMIILAPAAFIAIYIILQKLSSTKPEITVRYLHPDTHVYQKFNIDEVNAIIAQDKSIRLSFKVKALADWYRDDNGEHPRNIIYIKILDEQHQLIGKYKVKLDDSKGGKYWTGEEVFDVKPDKLGTKLSSQIIVNQSTTNKAADKIPVRMIMK